MQCMGEQLYPLENRSYHSIPKSVCLTICISVFKCVFASNLFQHIWDISFKLGTYIRQVAWHSDFEFNRNLVILDYIIFKSSSDCFCLHWRPHKSNELLKFGLSAKIPFFEEFLFRILRFFTRLVFLKVPLFSFWMFYINFKLGINIR